MVVLLELLVKNRIGGAILRDSRAKAQRRKGRRKVLLRFSLRLPFASLRLCAKLTRWRARWPGHRWLYDRFGCFVRSIPTILIRAVSKRSLLLRRLLQQERRVALRARFENRFVPVDDVTVRILRTPVKRFAAFRFLDDNLTLTTRPRT